MDSLLICPRCQEPLERRSTGILIRESAFDLMMCGKCVTATPAVGRLYFFTETRDMLSDDLVGPFQTLINLLGQPPAVYEDFLEKKAARKVYDIYAGMQPFNESSVAFEPFIEKITPRLKPGEVILDTWCRTGWTPGYLSGLFPDQQIVSVWEGNNDTLGYPGFWYWYGENRLPDRVSVLFHSMNQPLPLLSQSVKLVYGLDTMHRYSMSNVVNELLRLRTSDGLIFFPHVHMSNHEPDPFFERGGSIRHGKEYDFYFKKRLKDLPLKGLVLSEPVLYDRPETIQAESSPDQPEYNGLLAILPNSFPVVPLKKRPVPGLSGSDLHIIVNPAIRLDLNRGIATLDPAYRNDTVSYFLFRHPIFKKQFSDFPVDLSVTDCKILYLAGEGLSVDEIRQKLPLPESEFESRLTHLIDLKVCSVFRVPSSTFRLQFLHSTQQLHTSMDQMTLAHLWKKTQDHAPDTQWLVSGADGSGYTFSQADELVGLIRNRLLQQRFRPGDRILIQSPFQEEVALIIWAAVLEGMVAVPIDPALPADNCQRIIEQVKPSLIFAHPGSPVTNVTLTVPLIETDDPEVNNSGNFPTLSGWLEESDGGSYPTRSPGPEDLAVILFTSGTTNLPKGVCLSHRAMFRSTWNAEKAFGMNEETRFLSPGDAFTMSGLRNPVFATVAAACPVIIAPAEDRGHLPALLDILYRNQVTHMSTVPAFLRQVLAFREHLPVYAFNHLKLVLCTGTALPDAVKTGFEQLTSVPVLNYYGLTETSGICVSQRAGEEPVPDSIGKPVDCLAHVLDPDGNLIRDDQPGELAIFSLNLMSGYWNQPGSNPGTGYFFTGDRVVRLPGEDILIKGRIRDIIKTRDGNILIPDELESVLVAHPDVEHAGVVSKTSSTGEERIFAALVLRTGVSIDSIQSGLNQFITSHLGPGKLPDRYFKVESIPSGVNGKTLRTQLANLLPTD
ncbi:MAG: acyl--CoA ligase [Bacteroidetes bacterium]|nr:acyl--CoA ligase [Bacteroidota bacterium]